MRINLINKTVHIQDENKVKRFLQKTAINIDATSGEEIYRDDTGIQLHDYLRAFEMKGFSIEQYHDAPMIECEAVSEVYQNK